MSPTMAIISYNLRVPATVLQQEQPQPIRDVVMLLLVILISAISLVAMIILLRALFPKAGQYSQRYLQRSPWRSFFIGLANYIFLGGISIAIASAGIEILNLVALLILGILVTITAFGLSGFAILTGERIAELRHGTTSPLQQTVWGIVLLEVACLLPCIGWFLLAPIVLMTAFGSAILAWRHRKTLDFEMMG